MKILVFSDSHGRLGLMLDAVEKERPQRVFFLGDCYRDGQALADAYPDIPMELVNEVMLTITDPAAMLGPEVGSPVCWPVGEGIPTFTPPQGPCFTPSSA